MSIAERITDYLANGGLFNPEQMEPEKVRDLLIDCRTQLAQKQKDYDCMVENFRVTNASYVKADKEVADSKKERDEARHEYDNARRELVAHREKAQGNYWAWQGNGEDHLESISYSFPVVIGASQLQEIIKERDETQKACTQLLAQCDQFRAACAAKDKALGKLFVAANEFSRDYDKGDFDLPKLASLDMASMEAHFTLALKALAITCGEGWKSPEDVERIEGQRTYFLQDNQRLKSELERVCDQADKLEAEAAVLRNAVEVVGSQNHNLECPKCRVCEEVDKALATTAGQSLLDELERYKAALEELWKDINSPLALEIVRQALQQKGEKLVWERYVDDEKGMRVEPPKREQQKGESRRGFTLAPSIEELQKPAKPAEWHSSEQQKGEKKP